VSTTAAAARPNPVLARLSRAADAVTRHVVVALVAVVGFQIVATVALAFSVNRNGWLTYQGGDQIWLVTSGWFLGMGMMSYALTGHGWPMLLAPLTWITGSSSVQLLPLTTVLQVGLLAPIATLAVYDIGARLAGRLAGVWCAAAFAVAPFVAIPYFVQRYHDSWVDQFLPQALGLTQQADFPSVVAVLVSVAFTVRAFRAFAYREAVLAGTFAGVALAFKPANALFLGGPLVALALARRWTHLPLFLVSLAPALLALMIWKARGLGEVPLFAQGEATRLAAGLDDPVMVSATSWLDRTVRLDLDTWRENMSNLREFTWSARVLQFLPLAELLRHGVREPRGRPLRLPRRDPRDHPGALVRRSRSADGCGLPGRRRGQLARRRHPGRRVRDQPAGRSAGVPLTSDGPGASSASTRVRSSATSCASSTLSSVSFERTVE
jgi:hypothetical protein